MLKHVTAEEFRTEVNNGLVVAEFFSPTCGPCKMLGFVLKDIDKNVADVNIMQVDFTQNKELAEEYKVTGYPTIIIMSNGEEKQRFSGLQQKTALVNAIEAAR